MRDARARVFTDPHLTYDGGERVVMTASVHGSVGAHRSTAGRPIAVIAAGADGVRVRPVVKVARLGLTALAAAAIVWTATRRPAAR
jgi:hypothetical protein